jgi:hypothetical protein
MLVMARAPHIPDVLRDRVFTTAEAAAAGLTSSMLRGRHVVQIHRGVWRLASSELTFDHADDGTWLAKGDLVLRPWRIIVEHDGWHHERDAAQRQKDHLRRERIEAAGWTLIVVTQADFAHPTAIVARVFEALVRRGYRGPPPELGRIWQRIARNL